MLKKRVKESPGVGRTSMSLEENKAIVRKFVEIVFGKRNWDLLDDLMAPDYVDPDYPQLQGLGGLTNDEHVFESLPRLA